MKIILAGGSGQLGAMLGREFFADQEPEVVVLSRRPAPAQGRVRTVEWDGVSMGAWAAEFEGADIVVNLAGRTVNCRYTDENKRQMMDSRVESTRVVGQAIAEAPAPPPLWLQMSTATIYAHRFDEANDEATGRIGGSEPGVPAYWSFSVEVAKAWERELDAPALPETRRVALRSSMVMSPDAGGVFEVLSGLVRARLGGAIAGGKQYVSWIHETDFVAALTFIAEHPELTGPVNVASPNPLPQAEFMAQLREAWGVGMGLAATRAMVGLGAVFLRTDPELVLKSRRVVPGRLLEAGFRFQLGTFPDAAADLVMRTRDASAPAQG